MTLDIKTLMLSILGISFIFVLSFSLYQSGGRTQKGFKIWTTSIMIQGIGYIFFVLRGSIPGLLKETDVLYWQRLCGSTLSPDLFRTGKSADCTISFL